MDEVNKGSNLKGYCDRMADKYGRDSNMYRVRVRGLMPLADADTLIPMDWVMDSVNRDTKPMPESAVIAGIDVAAGGDNQTIVTVRHGNLVIDIKEYDERRSEELLDKIVFGLEEPISGLDKPHAIGVDVIGVGWGISGGLRSRGFKNVRDYKGSEKALDDVRFYNKRAEDYWKLRELFERGHISIPNDDELVGQLTTIKWNLESGRIKIESKKDMLRRGVVSPDKADSLKIAFSINDSSYTQLSRERGDKPRKKNEWYSKERSYMAV
jgi:hypothetical protein